MRTALAFAEEPDERHPSRGDAKARAVVRVHGRSGVAVLMFVDRVRGRAKVRLPSGAFLVVPLDDVELAER